MAETNGNGGNATGLTVREWLARLDTKLDKVDGKLDGKADKSDLSDLEKRVRGLELWRSVVIGLAVGVTVNLGLNLAQVLHVVH